MKNVIYEEVKGTDRTYELVKFICTPTVNPADTKDAVTPLLAASPEWERIKSVQLKIDAARKEAQDKAKLAKDIQAEFAAAAEDPAAAEKAVKANPRFRQYSDEWKAALSRVTALQEDLKPLVNEYDAARDRMYAENPVYFDTPGTRRMADEDAAPLEAKLAAIQEAVKKHEAENKDKEKKPPCVEKYQRVTTDGEIVPDYRGVEYWRKSSGKWVKEKIEKVGITLPSGAKLTDALTPEIQAEISAQQEADRLAALTPEQKASEIEGRVNALKREAVLKKQDAEIADETFDAKAWFQAEKASVQQKYA
jgi:hypothetical protein